MDRNKRELSNEQRRTIYDDLMLQSINGKLNKGVMKLTAEKFGISSQTISKIWHRGQNNSPSNVTSKKAGRCGRKKKDYLIQGEVRNVPFNKRKTIRSLAGFLKIPKSSLHRRIKAGDIRACSSTLKPFLTKQNEKQRIAFVLLHLQFFEDGIIRFEGMFNIVHVDEKWFNLTEVSGRYYIELDEPEPHRQVKSKRFITKVMFLAAVARPRFDHHHNQWFDGKIGIWPFIKNEPAKRNSKNRCRGTSVTTTVAVGKIEYRKMLMDKVLPAIRSKWPGNRIDKSQPIFIQQDNAKPHISINDHDFVLDASSGQFDIRMTCQPPNSPDMNILDLGYFRAIQSRYYSTSPSNIDEIIKLVEQTFEEMPRESLNKVFLSLQACMIETLRANGGNNYKQPHMAKDVLINEGALPVCLSVDSEILSKPLLTLNQ